MNFPQASKFSIPALVAAAATGLFLAANGTSTDGNAVYAADPGFDYTATLINPPLVQPPNVVALTPAEQLGKNLLFDTTLSNPAGMACATCHLPTTGFTGPNTVINYNLGVMPGVVTGRFGHRKPQTIAYAAFSPVGPYFDEDIQVWLGGTFWDGRTPDLPGQAKMPFLDADEMANIPTGPYPPHAGGYSSAVVARVKTRPYANLFAQVYGAQAVASATDSQFYGLITQAIADYESSLEVNQFSSKYDGSKFGVPSRGKYQLSAYEERGRQLFFGKAQCFQCHSSATLEPVLAVTGGKDVFTMYCYANIGVPKNPQNPYYTETSAAANPNGSNPLGANFIDYGLGGNPNPAPGGQKFMTSTPGDMAAFRGLFKAPSLRNADARPRPDFIKAYMHNGVFKSLAQVIHFYNKRNIAINAASQEIAFDLRVGPPKGYFPLFAPPEVMDNVQNVAGVTPALATSDVASNGQVGNLQLSVAEEAELAMFLMILTDGFMSP